jgi:Uma2 family endonuclease
MEPNLLKFEDLPHYTYDDYAQWEGQWELIQGIPYAMTPAPSVKHQRIGTKIVAQLERLLEHCPYCTVLLPVDFQVTEDTVLQPDVLIVCSEDGKHDFLDGQKLTIPPVMVFEILSPSTEHKDRILKYQLYEYAGVRYYCIVDPDTKSADVFVMNQDKYQPSPPDNFDEGKMTFYLGKCDVKFDFPGIFKD